MIKLAFLNLLRRKTRSILAMLGLVLGVGAIIVINSLVQGMYDELNSIVSSIQGIDVMEKNSPDLIFSEVEEDLAKELEKIRYVNVAIPEIYSIAPSIDGKLTAKSSLRKAITIYAPSLEKLDKAKAKSWIKDLYKGDYLEKNDKGKVLIGKKVAERFHKKVGNKIKIDGKSFTIKGIFSSSSSFVENMIVMSLEDAKDLFHFKKGYVSSIHLDLEDNTKTKYVEKILKIKYGDKYDIKSSSAYEKQFSKILSNFRLFMFSIVSVSAIIAAIAIMNVMLMSVMERFREIGTLKAIGWTKTDILLLILLESIILSIISGMIGALMGFLISNALSSVLPTHFTFDSVIFSFLFSITVGVLSGIYPAFKASSLKPAEALRHE